MSILCRPVILVAFLFLFLSLTVPSNPLSFQEWSYASQPHEKGSVSANNDNDVIGKSLPKTVSAPQDLPIYLDADGDYSGLARFYIDDGSNVSRIDLDVIYPREPVPNLIFYAVPEESQGPLSIGHFSTSSNRRATGATDTLNLTLRSTQEDLTIPAGIPGPFIEVKVRALVASAGVPPLTQPIRVPLHIEGLMVRDGDETLLAADAEDGSIILQPGPAPTPSPAPRATIAFPGDFTIPASDTFVRGSIPVFLENAGGLQHLAFRFYYYYNVDLDMTAYIEMREPPMVGNLETEVYLHHRERTISDRTYPSYYEVEVLVSEPLPQGASGIVCRIPYLLSGSNVTNETLPFLLDFDSERSFVEGAFDPSSPPEQKEATLVDGIVKIIPPTPTATPPPAPGDPVGFRILPCESPLYTDAQNLFIVDGIDADGNIANQGFYTFELSVDNDALFSGTRSLIRGQIQPEGFRFELWKDEPGTVTLTARSDVLEAPEPQTHTFEAGGTVTGTIAVRFSYGSSMRGIRIDAYPEGETERAAYTYRNIDETYRLERLPPGVYSIVVRPVDYLERASPAWAEYAVRHNVAVGPHAQVDFEVELLSAGVVDYSLPAEDGLPLDMLHLHFTHSENLDAFGPILSENLRVPLQPYVNVPIGDYQVMALGRRATENGEVLFGTEEPLSLQVKYQQANILDATLVEYASLTPLSPINGAFVDPPGSGGVSLTWQRPVGSATDTYEYAVDLRCRCSGAIVYSETVTSSAEIVSATITPDEFSFNPDEIYIWNVVGDRNGKRWGYLNQQGLPYPEFGFDHAGVQKARSPRQEGD